MNILFVTFWKYPHVGGISSYMSTLKNGLESTGNKVHILSYNNVKEELGKQLTLISLIENYRILFANLIEEFVSKNKIDIIVANDVISLLAAKQAQLNIPCLLTVHGYLADEYIASNSIVKNSLEERYLRAIEEIAYIISDNIVVVGERIKEYISKIIRRKIFVLDNFVDTKRYRPYDIKQNNETYTILFAGRLTKQKGVIYLVEALELLLSEKIDAKLIVAGDGEERNLLKKYILENKLENNIELLGIIDNKQMFQIYNRCNVVVIPSIKIGNAEESFGFVAIEAMACGKPVIASNIGGLRKIIEDGYNGFLVPERNPEAIAEKIKMLMSNPELSKEVGINARKTVEEKFSVEIVVKKYLNIYKETINKYYELRQWPLIINNSVKKIISKINTLNDEAKKYIKINTLICDGRYDDALKEINNIDNRVMNKYKDVFNYFYSYIYLKLGNVKCALDYISKIKSMDNDKYRLLYGDILLLNNDYSGATEQYLRISDEKLRNIRVSVCNFISQGYIRIKNHNDLITKCLEIFKENNYKLDITYLPIVNGITGGMRIIYEQINRLHDRGHNVNAVSYYSNPDWFNLKINVKKVDINDDISKHINNNNVIIYTFWNQWYEVNRFDNTMFLIQGDEFLFDDSKLQDIMRAAVANSYIYAESKFLAVSRFLSETIQRKYGRYCEIIKNAIDIEKFYNEDLETKHEKIKIIIVGNAMLKFKGFDDIFKAFDIVRSKGYDFDVIWITQTQPEVCPDYIELYINPLQDKIPELYREADIYVCGSYYEACPLPPLEAMASGCAVVTTDNGGVSEYAIDGYNCLMVKIGDYIGMAESIIKLIEDKQLRTQLISNSLKTAKEFTWDKAIDILENLLIREYLDIKMFKFQQIKNNTLSLCLITKDEEKNIARCINSVKDIVDEIVVVDTGSKDRTVEIAESFGAKVIHAKWEDDFSKAKNIAIENATSDWILFLDADEEIAKEDVPKIKELMQDDSVEAYLLKFINYAGYTVGNASTEVHYNFRLFRNNGRLKYIYPVHENLRDIVENRVPVYKKSDVTILHYGYLNETRVEKNKTERYIRLILNYLMQHPDDQFQHSNLAVEYYNAGQYDKALKHLLIASRNIDLNTFGATRIIRYLIATYTALKDYDTALKIAEDAKAYYSDMADYPYLEGMIYFEQKRYEKAIEVFKECLEIGEYKGILVALGGTGSYRARYMRAMCFERLNRLNDAVENYIEALKLNRTFQDAFIKLFDILIKNERPEDVRSFFNKYVDTSSPVNKVILARLYMNIGRFDIAKEYLDEINLDIEGLNNIRGIVYMGLKNYDKAIQAFDAEYGKAKREANMWKVLCYILSGQRDNALKVLENMDDSQDKKLYLAVLGKEKTNFHDIKDSYFTLLDNLIKLGEFDIYNEVLSLYVSSFSCQDYERYGQLMESYGLKDLAFEAYMNAANLDSKNPTVYRYLSEKAVEQGMYDEALSLAFNALNLDERDVDSYTLLYKIYVTIDRFDEAEQINNAIKDIYPDVDLKERVSGHCK
ncbi:glycosyltransferase [Caldanaerobius polysaccharolyticus]|uniref:glycosyltransferase n=1 Tax=Caldanaerobius polysaccharolyticus TaxID=44256 RepID=UPI000478A939|nr:glycosyltransferase [Caldanaerobius polysaccharolyticus]